jgi:hypothetical protein
MRILWTMAAIFVLPLTVSAEAGPLVPLLPAVVVQSEEVRLSDFLPPGAPGTLRAQAAQVMLGQTPRPGTVRVMDTVELEHQLRPELLHRLSFPPRMTVQRGGYTLESKAILEALQSALERRGITVKLGAVDGSAVPPLVSSTPQLRVLDIHYDALRRRWNARIAIDNQPGAVPFLVTAAAAEPLSPYHADAVSTVRIQPLLKTGQRAVLVLNDAGFHATIPVVCLESGIPGQEIRVRDETSGKIHHAWVSDGGTMHVLGERDEAQ